MIAFILLYYNGLLKSMWFLQSMPFFVYIKKDKKKQVLHVYLHEVAFKI